VTAVYAHPLFIPFIGVILDPIDGTIDSAYTLSTTERFRVENVPLNNGDITGLATC
jgi:hypothetical protein